MKTLFAIVILNLIVLSYVNGSTFTEKVAPEPIQNVTTVAPSTTNKPTTSKPPVTTPSSTTSSTTSTTTKPTSTTTKPTTPTTASTTTSATTSTSTTSTSAPSSTTPAPTPDPKQGTWQVNDTSGNYSCVLLKMAAWVTVNYTANSSQIEEALLVIPTTATSAGVCGETEQNITLSWPVNTFFNDSIEFVFKKNGTKFDLASINITVLVDNTYFPNAKDANTTLKLSRGNEDFVTPLKMSYKCTKTQELAITNSTKSKVGAVKIKDFQVQAFGKISNTKFSDAKDCEPFETPDVVPIAVGCALMGLIVVVLIGYLIGRRRNQARGYLSMFTETKKEADYIPMKNLSCFQ